MKSFALISMLCLAAVLLALFAPALGQPRKFCPAPDISRDGACTPKGKQECFYKVLARFSARQLARNIKCVDIGKNKSKCTSEIVCSTQN